MDITSVVIVAIIGFIAAVLLSRRHLIWLALLIFSGQVAGLFYASFQKDDTLLWMFGLSLMYSPVLWGLALAGAVVGQAVRAVILERIRTEAQDSNEPD
ncbi:hypothetical protein [Xanthomonas tesorieronis]|uniref:hypothetical protein n=1 Tax=Xanthomonas tesorieronis TaxID=3160839 RepID=UPI003512DC8A